MTKYTATMFFGILILCGCAPTTPAVSLSDVKTSRVYQMDKLKVLEAVRRFCPKYDFTLRGIEPEAGRARGYKRVESFHGGEPKTIIMLVSVNTLPGGKSQVDAKFGFDKVEGTPTRQDETTIVDCYTRLFRYLDGEEKDAIQAGTNELP